ncbi:hypothetical protein BDF14DRAFT_1843983, partial [Spinellus fusiger]
MVFWYFILVLIISLTVYSSSTIVYSNTNVVLYCGQHSIKVLNAKKRHAKPRTWMGIHRRNGLGCRWQIYIKDKCL